MKKAFLLGLLALGLASCASVNNTDGLVKSEHSQTNEAQTINFTGPYDLTVQLTSNDGFETAILVDNSGKEHLLKNAISGSGVRMVGDDGVSIHFKNFNGLNEGVVELVKDKPIQIKEFKAD